MKNRYRSFYERYWGEDYAFPPTGLDEGVRRMLARHVSPEDECLDVGCGRGRTALWLRDHAASCVGVDVSSTAVEEARRKGVEALVVDDAGALPFPDDSFDLAVCIEVMEHLFEPQRAAQEILRVLRPGGCLIATVPNVAHWRRRLDMMLLGRWNPYGDDLSIERPWRDPHIRFFTPRVFGRMLEAAGFAPVETGGHGPSGLADVPYLNRVAGRRDAGPLYRRLQEVSPSLFGTRVNAVGWKPGSTSENGSVRGSGR